MRIEINERAAEQPQSWSWLTVIIQEHVLTEHHQWEVSEWGRLKGSAWLRDENGGTFVKRELAEYVKRVDARGQRNGEDLHAPEQPPITPHNLSIEIDGEDRSPCEVNKTRHILNPRDAYKCLSAPLTIFVEDADSDGEFWVTIWTAGQRERLIRAFDERRIEFAHCGGKTKIAQRFARWNRRRAPGPLRALVLRDSDKLWEAHSIGDPTEELEAFLPAATHRHVLKKREIENYLPSQALKRRELYDYRNPGEVARSTRRLARRLALERLNDDARSFYDMKEGFKTHSPITSKGPPEHIALFANVSAEDLEQLRLGISEGQRDPISDLFETAREHITREALEEICDFKEFEVIMDAIEALL